MAERATLDDDLAAWAAGDERTGVAAVVAAIARATATISARIARGAINEDPAAVVGAGSASDSDPQKQLDAWADALLTDALRGAGVRVIASEESDHVVELGGGLPIAVAFDPVDGSSNIATNVSIGTIFSLLPLPTEGGSPFLQPGSRQIAAGYVIYGPQTTMMLTLGSGTRAYVLDPDSRRFVLTDAAVRVAPECAEYAINASNYRHWSTQVRAYVDDCTSGRDGPRGADTNTRWIASMVAEAHRILVRGGVYLYPRDMRPGYENGRLRLIYEANPIALLIEQAGGAAIDGMRRILDIVPRAIHERVPLIFGSAGEVARIRGYFAEPEALPRAPLFHRRGLFKG